MACAAAMATIRVIEEEGLLENATWVGRYAMERLKAMQAKHSRIGDVRGLGLMIGIEFVKEGREPLTGELKKIMDYCFEKGLILVECGVDKNVIRLAPPLIITGEEMEKGLDILEEAIGAIEI